MTPLLVVFGLVGWVITVLLGIAVARSRSELRRVEKSLAGHGTGRHDAVER